MSLLSEILDQRSGLRTSFGGEEKDRALGEILRVGTSAGGARAKALLAFDPETLEVRSGQLDVPPGFQHWILKFDGVEDRSREIGEPKGYGVIEWVYAEMARRAGIEPSVRRDTAVVSPVSRSWTKMSSNGVS